MNNYIFTQKLRVFQNSIKILLIAILIGYQQLYGENESDSLKLLVVTGGPTLRYHIDLVPTSFYTLFEGYENIQWDHASSDEAAFQSEKLADYDILVMYNRSDSLSKESEQNLRSFVESGKGIVILHHALGSYNKWKWWWHNVVGAKYQMKDDKDYPKSEYYLDQNIHITAVKKHSITSAVGDFTLKDEAYKKLWISPDVKLLYKTDNNSSDGPIAWISPYENSRVVVIQPGHTNLAHKNEKYRLLVYHAILWSSGTSD